MAFYHDQHMAWQQRVSKELSVASRFLTQYSSFNRPSTSSNKSAYSKASKQNNSAVINNDLRHLNVFAEVRGKYARPPPPNHSKQENPLLAPKENNLISRPATSGSLRPRSQSNKKGLSELPAKVNEMNEEKSVSQSKKRYRSVAQVPHQKPKYPAAPLQLPKKIDHILFENNKTPVGTSPTPPPSDLDISHSELQDQVLDLEANPEDFRDKSSQITTSSQRRYILELESLLREEKMKRYKIEENLKKIIDDKRLNS